MICDKSIKLTKSELAFLRKGPRFMMRQPANESDFCTEIGKMIVKEKYEKTDWTELNTSSSSGDDHAPDVALTEAEKQIVAESGMTYDKEYKVVDMGRFKATNYKFNRYVHLPEAGSVENEAKHEIRKAEMMKIFKKTCHQLMHEEGRGVRKKARTMSMVTGPSNKIPTETDKNCKRP